MKGSKYGNVRIVCDRKTGLPARPDKLLGATISLDSQLEMTVYQSLIKDIDYQFIEREPKILLCGESGKRTSITLLPDFAINPGFDAVECLDGRTWPIYVEVKGTITETWRMKVNLLLNFQPHTFGQFIVVTNDPSSIPHGMAAIKPNKVRDFIRAYKAHKGSFVSFKRQFFSGR